MTTESVKVLIEAEDQASAKVEKAAQNVEASIKRVKQVGGQAKASTEFIGTLANQLGGTGIGGFAGELAQLTERISAFSEVSQAGGVGALAFKAGLVAATAITAFKVGETIGNWAFETQRWKEELQAAAKEAERLQGLQQGATDKRSNEKKEDISLIRDPEERKKAIEEAAAALDKEADGMATIIKLSEQNLKEAEKRKNAWSLDATLRRGEHQAEMQMHQDQLQRNKEKRAALRAEAEEYKQMLGRQAEVEAKKAKNAADDKSDAFLSGLKEQLAYEKASEEERRKMDAAKNTSSPEAAKEAERLLSELAVEKQKDEAAKKAEQDKEVARKKAAADQEAELARIEALKQRESERLELKRIELEHGKEAAKQHELELQGIDKQTAAELAKKDALLAQMEGAKQPTPDLQAKQGRLLTRGSGSQDREQQIAENTKQMLQAQLDAVAASNRMVEAQEQTLAAIRSGNTQVVVVA